VHYQSGTEGGRRRAGLRRSAPAADARYRRRAVGAAEDAEDRPVMVNPGVAVPDQGRLHAGWSQAGRAAAAGAAGASLAARARRLRRLPARNTATISSRRRSRFSRSSRMCSPVSARPRAVCWPGCQARARRALDCSRRRIRRRRSAQPVRRAPDMVGQADELRLAVRLTQSGNLESGLLLFLSRLRCSGTPGAAAQSGSALRTGR